MEGTLHLGGTTPEVENLVRIVAVGDLGRMNEVAELGVLRVIGMPEKDILCVCEARERKRLGVRHTCNLGYRCPVISHRVVSLWRVAATISPASRSKCSWKGQERMSSMSLSIGIKRFVGHSQP